MGVRELSKRLRESNQTPDVFSTSPLLHGKRIGVDLSVILHKSISSETGAGEFLVQPKGPNSKVINKCSRLCSYTKQNEITLVTNVDSMYHPLKAAVNIKRSNDHCKAATELDELLKSPELDTGDTIKSAMKLMKASAHVSRHILANAINVFA